MTLPVSLPAHKPGERIWLDVPEHSTRAGDAHEEVPETVIESLDVREHAHAGWTPSRALRTMRVVYQVHGGALPEEFFATSRVLTALLRRVLSWPDVVVLLSNREMRAYGEFAPSANLVMVPYGVQIVDVDLKLERYSPKQPLQIVYIGRLVQAKGIFDIVEAVRILRCRQIRVHVRFAGSGPAEQELRRRGIEAKLDDRVELLGPVFDVAKQHLWCSANVLALPSYSEGLPYALLESMCAGTVPVTTAVGGPHADCRCAAALA